MQIKEALLQAAPDIGTLTIWIDGPLNHDIYHKYCSGRRIIVRFDSLPGDHPLLVINQTHLNGDNLQVTVYEVNLQCGIYTSYCIYCSAYFIVGMFGRARVAMNIILPN